MPRIKPLTETGRKEYEREKLAGRIRRNAVGSAVCRKLTLAEFGAEIGTSVGSARKIKQGEHVTMGLEQWLKVIEMAGYEVREV